MNDPIRNCPRCGKKTCKHTERFWANLLASRLGTGVINLDVSYRWIASLRNLNRVVLVELKSQYEPLMKPGQELTLRDLNGTLKTLKGYQFEMRAFVLEQAQDWNLSTFLDTADELSLTLVRSDSAQACCSVIQAWYERGIVPRPSPAEDSRSYIFLDIDRCRKEGHQFKTAWGKKSPTKVNLICTTCSETLGKTAYVAFGEPAEGFGDWRESSIGRTREPEITDSYESD